MHAPAETNPLPGFMTVQADSVTLALKVTPRAPRNEIGEPMGNELRIKVPAPPVDAAVNEALLRLLADTLECPRQAVQLIRGQTSRRKVVRVFGLSAITILTKISAARP